MKKVMTAQFATPLGVEKEPPSGVVAEEVEQAVKDAQSTLPSTPLAVQDPETFQPPVPRDPKPMQTPSPTKTMTLEPTIEPTLGKESLGGASSSTQASKPHPFFINAHSYLPYPFFLRVLFFFSVSPKLYFVSFFLSFNTLFLCCFMLFNAYIFCL